MTNDPQQIQNQLVGGASNRNLDIVFCACGSEVLGGMMNVIKIVVDELPENCFHGNCIFPRYCFSQITQYWECLITEKMINDEEKCPSWCPLVVEIQSE